jgi:23S rRNA (cytidine2498-2'-O)-methyltransferase
VRAYLAVNERSAELEDELSHSGAKILERHHRLIVTDNGPSRAAWASNVWQDARRIEFQSITEAARKLQSIQPHWAFYGEAHFRRGNLIEQTLPPHGARPLTFGAPAPKRALGSFTLLEPNLMLASAKCSSQFPNGEIEFEETQEPPSRAYLKLWEVFTLTGKRPKSGATCLDLGGSPGGWTWVLASLGANVTSIDKAPLDPKVSRLPNVRFLQQSAFALDPRNHPGVEWLFSDVICYPDRLLQYVEQWLEAGKAHRFVCTLKFQGETDHEVARRFAQIPGSRLVHLHHNKHELTWFKFS